MHINLPVRYQHLGAVLVIFFSLVVFFREIVFGGKTFLGQDSIASHSFETVVRDASAQGIFPLWNPYIFCGMPGFASLTFSGTRIYDFLTYAADLVRGTLGYLFVDRDVGIYFVFYWVFGIGLYLLGSKKLQNRALGLVCALAGTYSMYLIKLVGEGHMTKVAVIAWFPYVVLMVENLREKFRWLEAAALAIVLRMMIVPSHIQYIFYIYFSLGIYFLFYVAKGMRKGKDGWLPPLRSGTVLAAATALALLMGADQYLSTMEYNPYSIRGSNPITETGRTQVSKTVEGGLDYDYATSWSLAPGEIMTFFIPSWYGFGLHTYEGLLSQGRPIPVNTYWGAQPFVDAPHYFGVVILVLALVGFVKNRKDAFVQFLAILVGVSLLISFGREFSLVYDLMYNYFPLFNKFRIPSMILMLLQVAVPLLAGYGMLSLLKSPLTPEAKKRWRAFFIGVSVVFVVALIGKGFLRGVYEGFFPLSQVATKLRYPPAVLSELYSFVFASVANDIVVGSAFILVVFGALYFFIQERMKFTVLVAVLCVAVLADLWRVDSKPMHPQPRAEKQQIFSAPDYVQFLHRDSSLYRVLELVNGQPPYNNLLAYWRIQSAYGYQGAKLRAYQDMVDVSGITNPLAWQLMDIKYILSNQRDTTGFLRLEFDGAERKVYSTPVETSRAFFVNRYEVASDLDILKKIAGSSFDPKDVAYVQTDPRIEISPPTNGASVKITRYGIQDIELEVVATGNNLLFLSETYYPKGWKAFIDGKETEIYRLNYLFRGIVVPAGQHKVEMRFEPASYVLGKNLSLGANIFLLLSFIILGYRSRTKKGSESGNQQNRKGEKV